jgi:predicted DNA-binding transcriptional regulator AlpA
MVTPHAETCDDLTDGRNIREKLGLKSARAFWDLVHRTGIPHYKLNNRVIKFRWSEVEEWLKERKKGLFAKWSG